MRDEIKNRLREIGKAYHQQDMVDFDGVTVKPQCHYGQRKKEAYG